MDLRDKEKLQRNYAKLLDVVYSDISPHLISNFVITLDMHTEIDCRPTDRKKMEKLLTILPTRGGGAFKELVTSLKPAYNWIARDLEVDHHPQCGRAQQCPNQQVNNNMPDGGGSIGEYLRDVTRILQRCSRVSTHWTFLAYSMNLLPPTIQDIKREMSYSGGHEYAIFSVLEAWLGKVGDRKATFSALIKILRKEQMVQSAEDILEYWGEVIRPQLRGYQDSNRNNGPSSRRHRSRSRSPVITDV